MPHGFEPPESRGRLVDWPRPVQKLYPGIRNQDNLFGVKTDEELREVMKDAGDRPVVVDFGAPWCDHCKEMIPHFMKVSEEHPKAIFAIADVDRVPEISKNIKFTPTFAFYKKGKMVDEIFGANKQSLRDHLWLHLD
mmetsp:Transcript_63994/g.202485  ORF Transcript_63994/g.202485 Transcript_63994/m.202485 type:complete len:137 (-) Transcript_63994:1171-1581(-)